MIIFNKDYKIIFLILFLGFIISVVGFFNGYKMILMEWWNVNIITKLIVFILFYLGLLIGLLARIMFREWILAEFIFMKWLTVSGIRLLLLFMDLIVYIDYLWNEFIGAMGLGILLNWSDYIYRYVHNHIKFLFLILFFVILIFVYILKLYSVILKILSYEMI